MRKIYLLLLAVCFAAAVNAQNVTVSGALVGNGSYPTLSAAFAAINGGAQTAATISITIDANTTEPAGGAILNAGAWTSISIQPAGGAARTISGAATAGLPLIDLNGADNVTIDGLNSGGNSLTIENTTVSATSITSTIRFIGGATGNTINRCFVKGSGTMSVATNGAVIFFSTDANTANGNDNNTISNCDIGPAGANLPTKGILGNGSTSTTAIGNSGIIITNNDIHDYFGAAVTSSGIAVNGGCNTWTITNNRFYQSATRTWTTGATHRAIDLNSTTSTSGVQGMTVTGNIIGYATNAQTGTYTLTGSTGKFQGLFFAGITGGSVSNINSNTVASVSMSGVTSSGTTTSSPFTAILISTGNVISNSNVVGSQSGNGSLSFSTTTTTSTDVYGILNFGSDAWTSNSNQVGSITANNAGATGAFIVYGIRGWTGSGVTWAANSNIVGGASANSIQNNSISPTSQIIGINTNAAASTLTSNTIRNLTAAGGTGTTTATSVIGISSTGTSANQNISQNSIFSLSNSNTTAATIVTGIQFNGSTANVVERNNIYGLTSATNSATAEINGIRVSGGTTNFRNNMIAVGAGVSNAIIVSGINESAGTNNYYHNSVYVGGAPAAGSASSFAFNSTVTTNVRAFRDNVFFNGRNNSGASGKNYIVRVGGTAPNPTGLTINNNVYYANGSGAVFGLFNSLDVADLNAWRVAVGQDLASIFGDPAFNDPTNATPDLHIHATNPTVVEASGADVGVTDDFDGQTRAGLTPVDIGADAGNFVANDVAAPAISYTALGNTCTLTGVSLTATITDGSGVPTAGIGLPVLYWRVNAGAYTAATGTFIGSNQYQFNFASGVSVGDVISYYIVAQDNASTPNVGSFPAVGAGGFTTNPPAAGTPPTTPSSFSIQGILSGNYTVGVAGTYTTLTAAVNAYNTSCISGAVTFLLLDATYPGETWPIIINPNASASAINTLTIKPSTGVTSTITTALNSDYMIKVFSNYVTIDGSNTNGGTTRDLTISNTGTTAPSALLYGSVNPTPNIGGTVKNVIFINGLNTTSNVVVGGSASTPSSATDGYSNNFRFENNSSRFTNHGIFITLVAAAGNGSGTVITGNDFAGTGANAIKQSGITLIAVDGATVTNNTIGNLDQSTIEIDKGIWLQSGTLNTTVSGNSITNLGFNGTSASGNAYGIWIQPANATSNINVSNNTITNFTSSGAATAVGTTGIYVSLASGGITIENNTIRNMKQTNTTGFGSSGIQLSSSSTTANINVRNNMISDIASYGKATAGVADNGYGIVISNGAGYAIHYNSIHLNSNQTLVGGLPAAINITSGVSTAGAIDLRNNIFANTQTVGAERYAIYSGAANTVFLNINHNDYYTAGPNLGFIGSNRATLADIQTGFGGNLNSVSAQPSFVSGTDLHLTPGGNSALDGDATPIAGITLDIDGNSRDVSTPDIGADEFVGIAGVDMGATALVSPLASGCYTATETVTVTIRNYGSALIDFAVDPVTVTVTATGGYNQFVVLNSGTLAPNATQNVTMPATINMSANGTYTFNASTSVAGDITPGNDAMAPVNRVALALGGTYTIGAAANYGTLTAAVADYNNASCFTGPVVFEFVAGYTSVGEVFPITINANPAAGTNTLTIRPGAGQNPTISGTANAGSIIKLNGADYIIIDGSNNGSNSRNLTIQNNTTSTSGNAVIWLSSPAASNGATNNQIKNCIIEGNAATTSFTGIHVGGNATIGLSTAGLEANSNNSIHNNLFRRSIYGVTMYGVSTANLDQSNTISNNSFGTAVTGEGFSLLAINADRQQGLIIRDNNVQNVVNATNTSSTPFGGIRLLDSRDAQIYNNRVHDLAYTGTSTPKIYGIAITSAAFTTVGSPSNHLVYNNAVYRVTTTGTSAVWNLTGILASNGYGDRFYYNSVHLTGQIANATSGLSAAFANGDGNITTAGTNIDVRNNSFSLSGSNGNAGGNFWAYYSSATSLAGSTLNYNDLHCAGTGATNNVGRFNSTSYATLAAWQAATSQDANSIAVDPLYNTATILVPQSGSPLIAAATPVAGITLDILGVTRNVTTPTIGAYEQAGDAIPPTISYSLIPVNCTTGDRLLNGVIISDATGVPTAGPLTPRVYFRKNAGAWFSSAGTLASGTGINGTWDFTISAATMGGLSGGDVISYYVIAQDLATIPNVVSNPSAGLVADDVNIVTTHPTSPNQNTVGLTLNGTYTVGAAGTFTTLTAAVNAYNNGCLTGPVVFELLDASYTTGETFPLAILNNPSASSTNTLLIRPTLASTAITGGTTSTFNLNGARYVTIDGRIGSSGSTHSLTITNNNGTPAILFINDATDNMVTYADVKSDNTTTGVVVFSTTTGTTGNDNNTIDNCNISGNILTPTYGVYSVGSSASTSNSGIMIMNNHIIDVYSAATSSAGVNVGSFNSDWTIRDNHFYQTGTRTATVSNLHYGIFINNTGAGYSISGNMIGGSTANAGGTAWTMAGAFTNRFTGIAVSADPASTTSIQGNTIANFNVNTNSSASTAQGNFSGIWVSGGNANIGTITGNTIGSGTGNGSITVNLQTNSGGTANLIAYSGAGTVDIRNNTIGSINLTASTAISQGCQAIYISGGSPTVSNNLIGSTVTANSIHASTVSTSGTAQQMNGIIMTTGVSTPSDININNNTIANLTQAGTGANHYIRGISFQGQGSTATINLNIQNNTIMNLSGANTNATLGSAGLGVMGIQVLNNTSSGFYATPNIIGNTISGISATNTGAVQTNVAGIGFSNAANGMISRNRIYNLTNGSTMTTATTPPTANAIHVRAVPIGNITIANNMISLGAGQTTNTEFIGIWHAFSSSNASLYFNTINIEGTAASGALPSFGFLRGDNLTTSAIESATMIKNNIFNNTRSGGTGNHFAIANNYSNATSSANGWPAGVSDYNTLNSANPATVGYWNAAVGFAAWQANSAGDASSLSAISLSFANAATGDLHINMGVTPTSIESGGIAIAGLTTDYDSETRPGPGGSVNGGATSPDMGADEFDGVPLDLFDPIITYLQLTNSACTNNRQFSATATDNSGVNTAAFKPRVYYKRSTDGNVWNDNTSSTDGWKYAIASNASSPFAFTIDYSLLNGGTGVTSGMTIQYFVVAQDLAGTPNVAINSGTFNAAPVSVDLLAAAFPIGGTINSYNITNGLNTTLTIGAAGDYPNLTGATGLFNAINTNGLVGNTTVNILDASVTEPGTVQLNPIQDGGCSAVTYSLLIKPGTGVTSTLSGAFNSNALIRVLSSSVTIDGSNNGSNSRNLTISNTGTTTPAGVAFGSTGTTPIQNVTLRNSTVTTGAQTSSAVVISDGGGLGDPGYFNNVTIQNNSLQQARAGVYANAVVAAGNGSGTLITGNDVNATGVNSIRLIGIYAQGVDGVTISNNNVGNMVNANAESPRGIWLATGTINATVSGNTLTALECSNTGAFNPTGIYVTPGSGATAISINNNTISNMDNTGTGTTYAAIYSTSPNTNITNNTIFDIVQVGAGTTLIAGGIIHANGDNSTISGNTISNVTSSTSSTSSGIALIGTANNVSISRNRIFNIKNTSTTGWGSNGIWLQSSSTAANTNIQNNLIYDIASDGFDGVDATDNGYGIMVSAGGGYNIRFNSINMNTDQPDAQGRSGAINIASTVTTVGGLDIRNNIFANTQTLGNRYAIVNAAANTVFSNINYNDYYSVDDLGYNGTTEYANLAAWQAASGQDANSIAANPLFTTPTNLMPLAGSPVIGAGVNIAGVTNDFGNSTRNNPPSMGAFEARIVVAAKVFLHGAYNAGLGRHKDVSATWANVLNANATGQPYNTAAFGNYNGGETVTAGFFTSTGATTDITDWVLVELRDATTPATIISRRAAFVREDGMIVDLDGTSPVSFRGFTAGNYFIVVRHRNHLGVRTAATQLIDGSAGAPTPYDYSTAQAQAYQDAAILALAPPNNNNAMRDLGAGVFGMWAANGNGNTTVRASGPLAQNDYLFLFTTTLGGDVNLILSNVYHAADFNMDGQVRASGPIAQNDYLFLFTTSLGGNVNRIITQHQ